MTVFGSESVGGSVCTSGAVVPSGLVDVAGIETSMSTSLSDATGADA